MRYLAAIALLVVGSAGGAQTSTTCSTIGNVTNCQHQQPARVPDYLGAMNRAVPSYEDSRLKRAQAEALEVRARADQSRLSCRKKAMKAIDAGEYEKAKALAALCP